MMSIAQLWEICIKFLWDETYISGLDKFLKSHNVHTILDVGGGAGFPSIELKKLGWNITYSDRDEAMFSIFREKLQKENLETPYHISNWIELTQNIPQKFDAILCRGNSLIYVDSWGNNKISKNTKENIKRSLNEFFNILNKNGLLYIDVINKKEYDQPKYPIIEDFGEKVIDGKKLKLIWELTHDYKNKIRIWKSILIIDKEKYESTYYSYLLRHEELVDLLKEVGFSRVEETKIEGENNYDVFIAYK